MGNLALARLDARLIHGNVVVGWLKITQATHIIIIDDKIVDDPFLSQILVMAAPARKKLMIMGTQTAGEEWNKDRFGQGTIMVLFQNVLSARDAYREGFKFPSLQVGNIGMAPGKINVHGSISMDEAEAVMLQELSDSGCEIVLQSGSNAAWGKIKMKYFPDV